MNACFAQQLPSPMLAPNAWSPFPFNYLPPPSAVPGSTTTTMHQAPKPLLVPTYSSRTNSPTPMTTSTSPTPTTTTATSVTRHPSPTKRAPKRRRQADNSASSSGSDYGDPANDNANDNDDDSDESFTSMKKRSATMVVKNPEEFDGERRLAIEFEAIGTVGSSPQRFGRDQSLIPHGLRGTVTVLGQSWRIEVDHVSTDNGDDDDVVVCFTVVCPKSGHRHCVTETKADAVRRMRGGRTLCNRTFREAVDARLAVLERLRKHSPQDFTAALAAEYTLMDSHRISEGPLLFGLRHAAVQRALAREVAERGLPPPPTLPDPPPPRPRKASSSRAASMRKSDSAGSTQTDAASTVVDVHGLRKAGKRSASSLVSAASTTTTTTTTVAAVAAAVASGVGAGAGAAADPDGVDPLVAEAHARAHGAPPFA